MSIATELQRVLLPRIIDTCSRGICSKCDDIRNSCSSTAIEMARISQRISRRQEKKPNFYLVENRAEVFVIHLLFFTTNTHIDSKITMSPSAMMAVVCSSTVL